MPLTLRLPEAASLLLPHTFDLGSDGHELLLDLLVAAIDVINAVDARRATCHQAGQDQGGRGAKIAGHHTGALKLLNALNYSSWPFLADMRAHAVQFADVEEAIRENSFGDHAHAVAKAQQRHKLGLKVGRETRERLGGHLYRVQATTGRHENRSVLTLDLDANFFQTIGNRDQVVHV